MKKFKIEYTIYGNEDLQSKEIEAESVEGAKFKFRHRVKNARIWYVKELGVKANKEHLEADKIKQRENNIAKHNARAEKKAKKHAKNKVWKLKHPDGKRKHKES